MNEIQIYPQRLKYIIMFIIGLICVVAGVDLLVQPLLEKWIAQMLLIGGIILIIIMIIKWLKHKPKITLTLQGIQFHYAIDVHGQTVVNQFISWQDIHKIQLDGKKITLSIDDNPPDYERLTEIELSDLPKREIQLAYVVVSVAGLTVSAQKLVHWLQQMQQAKNQERNYLILSFRYEK